MKKFLILVSLSLCLLTPFTIIAKENRNHLRILELLPDLLCPLAVDPGIPEDFIAMSPNGTIDLYDWVYWGPKDVLKAYFEDPNSLKTPVLRVQLSSNVVQTSRNSFSGMESLAILKENDKSFAEYKTQWGNYPVFSLRTKMANQTTFVAWVGLNDPGAGWTLMFNLVYPKLADHPNDRDLKLWQNLLSNTTELQDGDFFRVYGQDLQEGYTIVNISGATLKMVAEKRQSDGALQVIVIPENADIKYHYADMIEGLMGARWKYREPIVKVYGEIEVDNKDFAAVINHAATIFPKNVSEFSVKKEEAKDLLIFEKSSPCLER